MGGGWSTFTLIIWLSQPQAWDWAWAELGKNKSYICLNYLIYETRALNFAFRKLESNTIQITIQVSHKHLRGLETVLILLIYGCRWKYRIRKTCLYDTRKYLKYHSRCHGITQKSLFFWGFDRQVAAQDPRIS